MKRQDRSPWVAAVLAIVVCVVMSAAAQEQGDATQKLIQRIAKSAKGDADAAAKLLAAAKALQDDPKVQVAICEAAYKYGIKAAGGFGSAIEALDILDKVAAERAAIWAEKRTVVYRILYIRATGKDKQQHGKPLIEMLLKTGDEKSKQRKMKEAVGLYREALTVAKWLKLPERVEISQKLVAAVHLLQVQIAIDSLKAKLAANPGDKATRNSLIEMCLVGLDSPAEAAKYLSDDCDESLRKYVPLAAKPLEELKEAECLALAQWYEQLIDKGTTPTSKANAAGRALRYYLQFLSLHETKDAIGVGARVALKNLEERIKKMGLKLSGGAFGPLTKPAVVTNFESANLEGWGLTGKAFGRGPCDGKPFPQYPASGFTGKRMISSYHGGDGSTGTLTSPKFVIRGKTITFLVGGGKFPGETCMNLIVDGKAVRTVTGHNSNTLRADGWDVADLAGKTATLQIVDKRAGHWAHILIDDIVQHPGKIGDVLKRPAKSAPPKRRIITRPRRFVFPRKREGG